VFWSWNANEEDQGSNEEDQKSWEAPKHQKLHFGNNPALYKLYFTYTIPRDGDDDLGDNPAVRFAKEMLPEVNRALFPEEGGVAPDADAGNDADAIP
jgi:hypothetical protein